MRKYSRPFIKETLVSLSFCLCWSETLTQPAAVPDVWKNQPQPFCCPKILYSENLYLNSANVKNTGNKSQKELAFWKYNYTCYNYFSFFQLFFNFCISILLTYVCRIFWDNKMREYSRLKDWFNQLEGDYGDAVVCFELCRPEVV